MARKPRVIPTDKIIHITNKCADNCYLLAPNEGACVIHAFHRFLREGRKKFGVHIYAAVIMSNHIHIVIMDPLGNASKFVGTVQSRLAKFINKLRGRSMSVFPRRFQHTVLGSSRASQLRILRYVILNPVKARLVNHPDLWPGYISQATYRKPDKRYPQYCDEFDGVGLFEPMPAFKSFKSQHRALRKVMKKYIELHMAEGEALGVDAVRSTDWRSRPAFIKKTVPRTWEDMVNSECEREKKTVAGEMRQSANDWRKLVEKLRSGSVQILGNSTFPPGTWVPPFVKASVVKMAA